MEAILVVLFIALIMGLNRPAWVLFWDKNPTRSKVFVYWLIASFFIIGPSIFTGTNNENKAENKPNIQKQVTDRIKYKLIRVKNIDASPNPWSNYRGARRTRYDIEVDKILSDEEIKKVLNRAVRELSEKRKVDALAVILYFKGNSHPFAQAYWAPYGDWGKAESGMPKSVFRVSISITQQLKPKKSSNVKKFGLSLEKRKMIYREICQSQRRTRQIATRKYPHDWNKQDDYMSDLDKKYEKQICDKYNITRDQKYSILGEGAKNGWPDK